VSTLLAHHKRRAAHGLHRCGWCGNHIVKGEQYTDQRIADDGTVWTWREHITCAAQFWHWWQEQGYGDEVENPREAFAEMLTQSRTPASPAVESGPAGGATCPPPAGDRIGLE